MEWIIVAVLSVLILFVLGLLIWLIVTNFASRKELAGQSSNIGLLQQQLEALEDIGWTVLRFHHEDDWEKIIKKHPGLFGGGR